MSKYHCTSIEMTHWMFWKWWWEEFTDRNLCFATCFFDKKNRKKTCPNIIAIVLKWLTECFESDCFKMNWNLLFWTECFAFFLVSTFFFWVRYGGSPLCFPVVVVMLRLPRDIPPPKAWWHSLFARVRALAELQSPRFRDENLQGFGTKIRVPPTWRARAH